MDPLETNVTYFVIGKRIKTIESGSKLRKKISDEELKKAVPIEEAWLFRTREEADNYARGTRGYNSKVPECPKDCVAIFEVQLRNPVAKPKTDTTQIYPDGKMIEFQFARVDADNLRYISGGVPGIQGKYQFKPTDEANIKTPEEWLKKIGFDDKINALQKKIERLQNEDPYAAKELNGIIKKLIANKKEFVEGRNNAQQFVHACTDAIQPKNTENLAKHRGLFASVKSFVESIIQLLNPKFKINSDSIGKIKGVEKSLGEIKPEQVVHETDIAKRTLKSDYEVNSENKVAKAGESGSSIKPG
ncbi:TPA: hypothetical protein ACT9NG_003039 [Legionella pneumophila]|nr:hypothetical protein [Legionella pneumophila]